MEYSCIKCGSIENIISDVIWNSMLIFNRSRACNRLNNTRAIFKIRSSIEVLTTPHSGLGKILILTEYSSGLIQFTLNQSIYNSIPIFLTTINWPPLSISIFGACWWYENRITWMKFCAYWWFVIVKSIKLFFNEIRLRMNSLEYLCMKLVSVKTIVSSATIWWKQ